MKQRFGFILKLAIVVGSLIHSANGQLLTEEPSDKPQLKGLFQNIRESEYEIHWQESVGTYQAPNRANNLRFTFFADGFSAQRRATVDESDDWKIRFHLKGIGEEKSFNANDVLSTSVTKRQARINSRSTTVDYENTEKGMRQNFLIAEKPKNGVQIRLKLDLHKVSAAPDTEGGAILFRRIDTSEEVMRYADLKSWDSDGKILPSKMFLNDETVILSVDDAGARYPIVVDPISFASPVVLDGDQASKFGFSIAYTGNLNGPEPHGGIIIGAPYYDDGQTDEGKVFVTYAGTTSFSMSFDWTAQSDQAGAHFGWSVAGSGQNPSQINSPFGDSFYAAVLVGAPNYNGGTNGSNQGKVFAWYGGASGLGSNGTPSNADWSVLGGAGGDYFGFTVAVVGDLNGDTYQDVAICSLHANVPGGTSDAGSVRIYKGGSSAIDTSVWTTIYGNATGAQCGYSIAGGGDVNNDGYADFAVGLPYVDDFATDTGRVWVFHGASSALGSPSTSISGGSGAKLGFSLAMADFNGDGYADILVGAPGYSNGQSGEGRAYVYYSNGSAISSSSPWIAESNEANAQFGYSVAAGDIDSDTYAEPSSERHTWMLRTFLEHLTRTPDRYFSFYQPRVVEV